MYFSLDIETLGLKQYQCDIIEFGGVLDDGETALEKLPRFHAYLTQSGDVYKGEARAFVMHQKIMERIANREPGYQYIPCDMIEECVINFLTEQGVDLTEPLVIGGKNAAGFDLPWLRMQGFGTRLKIHHRVLDVGSMYCGIKDKVPPGLEECLRRAGIDKSVSHTAIDDALDVVRCIRNKFYYGY